MMIDYSTGQNVDKLEYSGEKPEDGKIQISSDGRISLAIKMKNKCYTKSFGEEEITIQNYNSETCKIEKSFRNDSWEIIIDNLKFDRNIYDIGSEKKVEIDGTFYTVRLANTSSCPNDWPQTASQTTCGVVIEFVDTIIDKDNNNTEGHEMNPTDTNVGGWPASSMYNYLNTTIFNKLPNDLKNIILNTKTVSGHGPTEGETNFASIDKLYLLSYVEIWGGNNNYDSLKLKTDEVIDGTKQLQYYGTNGSTKRKTTTGGVSNSYWLRSADSEYNNIFFNVNTSGGISTNSASTSNGVAPAFRILD